MTTNHQFPIQTPMRGRFTTAWKRLTLPHPSVSSLVDRRRAELLSALSLVLSLLLILVFIANPSAFGVIFALTAITICSYILSRTIYFRSGIYLFTYGYTAIGFYRIFQGSAASLESSIYSTVFISILISSILLSRRGFIGLILFSTLAVFATPGYSTIPGLESENITRVGGILFSLGILLFSINLYRDNFDRERVAEAARINGELEQSKASLEKTVFDGNRIIKEANQQIQIRAARLRDLSEISQEMINNAGLPHRELLMRVTQTISEKLGYYHIGIFIMDGNKEYAVLQAANSKGGQIMLQRRHQLRAGGIGVVGYAAQSGRIRMALDTGSDAVFFNNPDLPETRSEVAIPLKQGNSILGVLDVQSKLPSAFQNEDVELLTILANQISSAISSTTRMDDLGPRIGATSGNRPSPKFSRRQGSESFAYNFDGTITGSESTLGTAANNVLISGEAFILNQSAGGRPTLAVPVKYREEIVGVIHIESSDQNRNWTSDEISLVQAISDRAAIALENARLFENASRRAEQEQTIAQVTTQIGSSTDFNLILQKTIQELGRALGSSRSFIQLHVPADDTETQE